ncbi:MAG: SusC/RagA family TonB-linked outer membrane protein [Bacteroidaceae bacterium]|nr:SusC/RagA family TonB-linked outer membrane protein [Bacteroidaceae bacterium]
MKKKIMLFLTCLFAVVSLATAQVAKVTGTVLSAEDGEPIPGASVMIDGTKTGVVTNAEGQFVLTNLPASAKNLRISCAGMLPQVVRVKPVMTISLETDNKAMDEVMVVAYGTQKKSTFTGSATVVGSEDIEKVQVTNAVDALRGKAAGVQITNATGQPGYTPSVRIRGINSINAGNSPLIVVDGAPFSGSLNDINPIDVESMTVLKDAAASALYGARGGNGVILVTTKGAKRGQDATITVDAKWGSNQKAVPEYNKISHPAGYYEMWYTGLKNYAMNKLGATESGAHVWANNNLINSDQYGLIYNVYNVPQGEYMIGTNGKLNPNATLGRVVTGVDGNNYFITPDDWIDETYHNSLRQEYTVSANGANERGSFYASANYLDNEGITYASSYKRFTTRLKADYMVKKWLKISGNMNYAHYDMDSLGEDGASNSSANAFAFGNMAPIYPMYVRDAQGHIIVNQQTGMVQYDYGENRSFLGLTRPFLSQSNPVSDNRLQIGTTTGNAFNGNMNAEIYLPLGFTFYSLNTIGLNEDRGMSTTNRYFGQYASQNGINSVGHDRTWSQNYQQRLNWHKVFGNHDVEVMAGHEYYKDHSYSLSGYKTNTFFDDSAELNTAVVMGSASSSAGSYNTESWLARAMYSYNDQYFGSASFVRQGSSIFHPDNRWGNFWSVGAGWMMNKEKWFNAKWVDELKLKFSYGENGNDGIGSYRYINLYGIENVNDQISLVPSTTMGAPKTSWEKNAKLNAGVEFSLWKGRLYGGIEFYANRTNDMLSFVSLPMSMGYTGSYENVGNMVNRGIEVDLHADVIRTKDFTWNVYTNVTSNRNKITMLAPSRKTQEIDGVWGYTSGNYFYGEGRSYATYFARKYAGVAADGQSLWYKNVYETDASGNIVKDANGCKVVKDVVTTTTYSEASDYLCGDCMPDVYGGFGTSFEIKDFDISADFQYQIGGQVYDGAYASLMNLSRGSAIHVDMLDAWSPTNQGSNIPRVSYNDINMASTSDRFLTSASYISLQNVTLGYNLPKTLLRKINVQKIRLYAVADNIWVWSKRQGLDPRQSITGGSGNTYYKPIRTISGGITVTF